MSKKSHTCREQLLDACLKHERWDVLPYVQKWFFRLDELFEFVMSEERVELLEHIACDWKKVWYGLFLWNTVEEEDHYYFYSNPNSDHYLIGEDLYLYYQCH